MSRLTPVSMNVEVLRTSAIDLRQPWLVLSTYQLQVITAQEGAEVILDMYYGVPLEE